ncbi:SRPBCC family protein [Aeromicrobium sp. NPDC092404]|uniref:SRPBCC family protein n=1 Tax=Aeromicrobium sp. NPDC092404 TaxID=3154976 RepID=UPI00341C944E
MGQPPLESTVQIAATPDQVWAAVSDVKAMRRRSPELVGMWLFGRPQAGRRGVNLNRRKAFVWPTFSRVTQWKPPANDDGRGVFRFHVWPTNVDWSYEIEPADGGTRLTERRTALPDPSLSVRLTARLALGGAEAHDVELCDGMDRTLAAIKSEVER